MPAEIARIFIGFDSRIPVAFHVLSQTILEHSSIPVSITPICLANLKNIYRRDVHELQSTEFSFSRFLTPYLSNFEGWSLFIDNDMVMRRDVAQLWRLQDDRYAAMCVQHDYAPKVSTKFMGAAQTTYQKKNWSSAILFNNAKCRALTVDYVNAASGLELHQFKWLGDDSLIGALPREWNALAGYDDDLVDPACVHYTDGGPFYPDYADGPHAGEWFDAFRRANHCAEADLFALTAAAKAKRDG